MRSFFANIRRILALDRAARGIAAIAAQVVEKTIIPRLRKLAKAARDPAEAERLEGLIADYEPYTRRETAEYKDLENTAEGAVVQKVTGKGLSQDMQDEVAQIIAQDFLTPIHRLKEVETGRGKLVLKDVQTGGADKELIRSLEQFRAEDPRNKARDFTRFFYDLVWKRATWRIDDMMRRNPDVFFKKELLEGDDEDRRDIVQGLPDETRSELEGLQEDEWYSHVKPMMDKYILSESRDEVSRAMYREAMKVVEKLHGGTVNMEKDVYPGLMKKYGISRSGLSQRYTEMKELIKAFFREVLDVRITDRQMKLLRMATEDRVAFGEFSRRLAAWVLGVRA